FAHRQHRYSLLMLDLPLTAIPTKAEDAFRQFKYVPYTALTLTVRLCAARGEEDYVINAQGGLTAKGLDRRSEKSISLIDWSAASETCEKRIRFHWGDTRAAAFEAHHKVVMKIARTHGWDIAMEYDIHQRDLAR